LVASSDADLVDAALAGSEEAFRELVRRYQRAVFGLIVRLVRNPARAEELSQDTFVKAFRALHTYNRQRKFSAWLLTIGRNTAVDDLRRHEPESAELDPSIPDDGQPTPHRLAEQQQLAAALRAAMDGLSWEQRELVVLKYEQELGYDEIAEITGMPIGTVKSSLHRARKALADRLEQLGWRGEAQRA
jgi:RNA polymerase sigma-70 factor (ECF subfamily)